MSEKHPKLKKTAEIAGYTLSATTLGITAISGINAAQEHINAGKAAATAEAFEEAGDLQGAAEWHNVEQNHESARNHALIAGVGALAVTGGMLAGSRAMRQEYQAVSPTDIPGEFPPDRLEP